MILERSKNAIKIMLTGLVGRVIALVCPFLVRTVFIYTLGAEYLGLNSLFSSVLSVMSLAELGFGSAVVFNMYKAIADDDSDTINALLYFYRKVYRIVGLIILVLGLALVPVLPFFIKGSYPGDINLTAVYLVFLSNAVVSYFAYAYLGSLIRAFQKSYVTNVIDSVLNILSSLIQIVLLLTVTNYYAYILIIPTFSIINNIRTAIVAKKLFPQYKPFGSLKPEVRASVKEKVKGLAIERVCGMSRNAFDSIFISIFLGLTQIAIYNNYFMIMSSINGFLAIFSSAVTAGAGNSVAADSQKKNHTDMMRMNFIYMWVSGWCVTCLICLIQPFMKLWMGEKLMLPLSSVILFCLYFYVQKMGDVRTIYVDATGIWWKNRFRSIVEAVTNIVLNFVLGMFFGVNGIIAATLISMFLINFCYGSRIIYENYYTEQKVSGYFIFHGKFAFVNALAALCSFCLCSLLPEGIYFVSDFLLRILICLVVPNLIIFFLYRKSESYQDAVPWVMARIHLKK